MTKAIRSPNVEKFSAVQSLVSSFVIRHSDLRSLVHLKPAVTSTVFWSLKKWSHKGVTGRP
jgi:hypothetical protein